MNGESITKPAPRLPLYLDVEFKKNYARKPEVGKLKNISLTGAFLEITSTDLIEPKDKLTLKFNVSGRERSVTASVIWKNQWGCGLAFKPFNNRDVQIVDDLMYFIETKRKAQQNVLESIFAKVA